jgi:hypothetical protein
MILTDMLEIVEVVAKHIETTISGIASILGNLPVGIVEEVGTFECCA